MKRGATDHPKVFALADALALPQYAAVGIVESLYHWCARYAPRGDIGRWPDAAIARGIGWTGEPGALVSALVQTGWLDTPDNGPRLVLHQIAEHADEAWKKNLARNGLTFWDGSPARVPKDATGQRADGVPTESGQHRDRIALNLTEQNLSEHKPIPIPRARAKPKRGGPITPIGDLVGSVGVGEFDVEVLVNRIVEASDEPQMRGWWGEVLSKLAQAGGDIGEMERAVRYVEDTQDPSVARAKDLGPFERPGGYLVSKVAPLFKAVNLRVPPFPAGAEVAANG